MVCSNKSVLTRFLIELIFEVDKRHQRHSLEMKNIYEIKARANNNTSRGLCRVHRATTLRYIAHNFSQSK